MGSILHSDLIVYAQGLMGDPISILVKNFDLKPIATPDEDLKAILG